MSSTLFFPPNRLAKVLEAADARPFEELVAEAVDRGEAIKPMLREKLDVAVQALLAACARPEDELFANIGEIGWLAQRVAEDAKQADRPELSLAARGVYEMMDALFTHGMWHTEALQVHVAALKVLASRRDVPEAELSAMREHLAEMRARILEAPR